MNKPKISVIMSVYNSFNFLSESIESILDQTIDNIEFIIIDDGSTDNSQNIIKKYINKDSRIILINNDLNIGLTKSLNKGLKRARGKYIARMDADDISLPERLEKQYSFLENNPEVFLIGTNYQFIDRNGFHTPAFDSIASHDNISNELVHRNCIYHPSIMFRNQENIYYREKFIYSQDYDLYLLLLTDAKKLKILSDKLIKYRYNPEAISQNQRTKQILFKLKAQEFYRQRVKYGGDKYKKFYPQKILNIDIDQTNNKQVLEIEIDVCFAKFRFNRLRKIYKKYVKMYGIFHYSTILYLTSFLGNKFVFNIRRILSKIRNIFFS